MVKEESDETEEEKKDDLSGRKSKSVRFDENVEEVKDIITVNPKQQ